MKYVGRIIKDIYSLTLNNVRQDTCYPHGGRANNAAYRHDRRADKRRYRHDREMDIQMLKMFRNGYIFKLINTIHWLQN